MNVLHHLKAEKASPSLAYTQIRQSCEIFLSDERRDAAPQHHLTVEAVHEPALFRQRDISDRFKEQYLEML